MRSLQIFAVGPFLKECTTLIYFTVPVEGNIYNYNLCKCTTEIDWINKSVEYKPLLNARLCGYLKSGAKVWTVIHTKTERTLCKTLKWDTAWIRPWSDQCLDCTSLSFRQKTIWFVCNFSVSWMMHQEESLSWNNFLVFKINTLSAFYSFRLIWTKAISGQSHS